MPQVSLVNRSGITIKIGDYVKLHPTFKDAFVFAEYWDRELIGTAAEQGAPGKRCLVNTLNSGSDVDLSLKQDLLISGVNIKTVNNESLLGSGNITITGGGDSNIDGGSAASIYLPNQLIDGGNV